MSIEGHRTSTECLQKYRVHKDFAGHLAIAFLRLSYTCTHVIHDRANWTLTNFLSFSLLLRLVEPLLLRLFERLNYFVAKIYDSHKTKVRQWWDVMKWVHQTPLFREDQFQSWTGKQIKRKSIHSPHHLSNDVFNRILKNASIILCKYTLLQMHKRTVD